MSITYFKKLPLVILASSFLLIQTSFGFLNHVDVLAKIIPMADGNEKIDVALVGSDLHHAGTLESDWRLILDLAEHLDLSKNSTEMFIEEVAATSYFREIPQEIVECLNKAQVYCLKTTRNTFSPGYTCMSTFLLLDSTYEEINKIYKKSIDWNDFFNRVKMTNLETRATFDFSQPTELVPSTCRKLLAVFSEAWSTEKLNQIVETLKKWEEKSHDKKLKQLFKDMSKQSDILLNRLKLGIKQHFTRLHPNNSADEIRCNLIKKMKSPEAQSNIETLKEATLLQKIFFSCFEYIDIIQAKALWHISQAEARSSNRTITLMGAYHANKSTIPSKIAERLHNNYKNIDPHFHEDRSLVPSLKKIGYTRLDSISFDYEILDRTRQNYNTQQPVDDKDIAAINDFASKASDFILSWANMSDDKVREMLAAADKN